MKLQAHHDVEIFSELEPEWNELVRRSTANRVFSTWEWQSAWWDVYHPGELWIVECRDDDNRLVGLAPWFIETHANYGRVVRSIGCVEVTDYLDIILDKENIQAALSCYAFFLTENRHMYDVIDLCNLPEASPTYQLLPAMLEECDFQVQLTIQEVCPIINLPSTWDQYLEILDKKQRHEIRRKLRRAEGATDQILMVYCREGT